MKVAAVFVDKFLSLKLLVVLIGGVFLSACQKETPALAITDVHMFALAPGQTTGAVYMLLKNDTAKSVVFNYVHSPIAGNVEVHHTIYDNGMMQMRQVQHLTIPTKSELAFKPGGHHLMLFDIHEAPASGSEFPLVIEFGDGEKRELMVQVRQRS